MEKTFYVAATPLGNLADASTRLKAVIESCPVIAAEDTRVARRLLSAMGIKGKKIVSLREHNEAATATTLAEASDGDICYLSDAGTPAVSDPGARAVAIFRAAGWKTVPVPGPCAAGAAMSVAGISGDGFVFVGFLPRARARARARLLQAAAIDLPIIIYASPRTAGADIDLIAAIDAQAQVCVCREISKVHEQIVAAPVAQIATMIKDAAILPERGEFTLVAKIARPEIDATAQQVAQLLAEHLPAAKAARLAGRICGADGRALHRMLSASKK
ncbi:MAG: SAM-dependent methyltransferase [Betaproteobacteria bacterium]|nr:SAM-dependent methyltransferase [Betaproteobacteria bacterium]